MIGPGSHSSVRGSNQNINNYAITDNPVFKVKIRDLNTGYEQSSDRNSKKTSPEKKFKIGDEIKGKSFDDQETYKGEIKRVEKNGNNDVSAIIILNNTNNKEVKLDPQTISKITKNNKNGSRTDDQYPYAAEHKHLLSFSQFKELHS